MFATTYCEKLFSTIVKTKFRSRLTDKYLRDQLRLATPINSTLLHRFSRMRLRLKKAENNTTWSVVVTKIQAPGYRALNAVTIHSPNNLVYNSTRTSDSFKYLGSYGLARSMWISVPRKKSILSRLRTYHNIRNITEDYIKVNVDICFSEKINTFVSTHISQFTRSRLTDKYLRDQLRLAQLGSYAQDSYYSAESLRRRCENGCQEVLIQIDKRMEEKDGEVLQSVINQLLFLENRRQNLLATYCPLQQPDGETPVIFSQEIETRPTGRNLLVNCTKVLMHK
ncbi:hypothetical protein ANN_18136 [Periplaneta americana]|uniref:Uncharacterized protein n=1 Tax=Periplaneta americana TaxID=6978 RepID=A0ABQ8SMX9_PERAM|nr:hypothetical protein ANN_18136 [Periplaneta americana]